MSDTTHTSHPHEAGVFRPHVFGYGAARAERLSYRRHELEACVEAYGANSTSYVLLEGAKRYFTSPRVEGFIAYEVKAGVYVIGGDPVCKPEDVATLLDDFLDFAGDAPVCAYQVMPESLAAFRLCGFEDVEIGKEAVFDPTGFSLAGGRMLNVRAARNKAVREGVRVFEHDPFAPGAESVNNQLRAVSDEWLAAKGSHEMGFLLGGLHLESRSAKRYFVACSGAGLARRVEGFVVIEPVYARHGYYLDVTRRRPDAACGTMELLTTVIFERLAGEGVEFASMGLAPLANLDDPDLRRHPRMTRLMRFAYEQIEETYDFKSLYKYKAKYHPCWERRYLCFRPRVTPRMLYATIAVRDSLSPTEFVRRRATRFVVGGETEAATLTARLERTAREWKHAASLVIGFCSALLLS